MGFNQRQNTNQNLRMRDSIQTLKYPGMMDEQCTKTLKRKNFRRQMAVLVPLSASYMRREFENGDFLSKNLEFAAHRHFFYTLFFVNDVNGSNCAEGRAGWR